MSTPPPRRQKSSMPNGRIHHTSDSSCSYTVRSFAASRHARRAARAARRARCRRTERRCRCGSPPGSRVRRRGMRLAADDLRAGTTRRASARCTRARWTAPTRPSNGIVRRRRGRRRVHRCAGRGARGASSAAPVWTASTSAATKQQRPHRPWAMEREQQRARHEAEAGEQRAAHAGAAATAPARCVDRSSTRTPSVMRSGIFTSASTRSGALAQLLAHDAQRIELLEEDAADVARARRARRRCRAAAPAPRPRR